MASYRFRGDNGDEVQVDDADDLVVIGWYRRGTQHSISPMSRQAQSVFFRLVPLFALPSDQLGVYQTRKGANSEEVVKVLQKDPEVKLAEPGLRDESGTPVLYRGNLFIKFADSSFRRDSERTLRDFGLFIKRPLNYANNAFIAVAEAGTSRDMFARAEELLKRDDIEACYPEVVRGGGLAGVEEGSRLRALTTGEELKDDEVELLQAEQPHVAWTPRAFPQQWHLQQTEINSQLINAHANVAAAWKLTEGEGTVIACIEGGFDIHREEFSSPGKIVAPHSFTSVGSDNPRPAGGENYGTAVSGVACADGRYGASGVAPKAKLMPLCQVSGLGSQEEADAFVWAAEHGADVICCTWGPPDAAWWNPDDPARNTVYPLPPSTRWAIDFAVTKGRAGRGCVIVWAAGNGNESVDADGYASYEKVIAVAACNDIGKRSAYSDYGHAIWCCFPSNSGESSLTPGIWTTDLSGRDGYNSGDSALGDAKGNYTNSFGGTSSAAPGVAGIAALVLAANPDLRWDEVKDVLRRSCDRIDDMPGEYDERGHSRNYGYGRVNAEAAVRLAQETAVTQP